MNVEPALGSLGKFRLREPSEQSAQDFCLRVWALGSLGFWVKALGCKV